MFTKKPNFKPNNYYWYRVSGRLSVLLVKAQTIQTLTGPQTEIVAVNGNYLTPVNSMQGEWWDKPIPIPTDEPENQPQA